MIKTIDLTLEDLFKSETHTPLQSLVFIEKAFDNLCEYCEYTSCEKNSPYGDYGYHGEHACCTCSPHQTISYTAILISALGNPIKTKPCDTVFNYQSWTGRSTEKKIINDILRRGKMVEFSVQNSMSDEQDLFQLSELKKIRNSSFTTIHPTSYQHVASHEKYRDAFQDCVENIIKNSEKPKTEPKTNAHVTRRKKR